MTKEEIVKGIRKYAGLGVCVIGIAAMGACLPPAVAHAAPTDTLPVATQTATPTSTPSPTNTPSPTPTATPVKTPMPELTYEQKKALLGIDKNFLSRNLGKLVAIELSFVNIEGRIWGITYSQTADPSMHDFYALCNNVYLFTLYFKNNSTGVFEYSTLLYSSSDNLKNLKLTNSASIVDMVSDYDRYGISYNDCQELKDIYARYKKDPIGTMNLTLSEEKIIDLIIKSTPQEKIIPFWVYTPGAKIPDILKGIYSETDYPPAPALPDTTVQQSSREYNGFGYKEFTSKDGASNLNYTFDEVPQKNTVDDNVIHGYRTKNYYGNSYVVTGIKPYNNPNLNPDQHTKIKI